MGLNKMLTIVTNASFLKDEKNAISMVSRFRMRSFVNFYIHSISKTECVMDFFLVHQRFLVVSSKPIKPIQLNIHIYIIINAQVTIVLGCEKDMKFCKFLQQQHY